MNAQAGGRCRLSVTSAGTSELGGSAHIFDCPKGAAIDVCRDALALSHLRIVAAQSSRVSAGLDSQAALGHNRRLGHHAVRTAGASPFGDASIQCELAEFSRCKLGLGHDLAPAGKIRLRPLRKRVGASWLGAILNRGMNG